MKELIDPQGRPTLGVFDDAVQNINVQDYVHRTPIGARANRWSSWVGFKQFQYFGVISDQLMFGCALAHLRHAAVAFAYAYEPGVGMVVERSVQAPLGLGASLSTSPVQGQSVFRFRGIDASLGYDDAPRSKSIRLRVGDSLAVDASFDETATKFQPMSICTRIGRNGWVYAHKVAGVPVAGTIVVNGKTIDLRAINAYAHHDFSAGYMRRETFWNWACLSGRSEDGTEIGLNVSCGVNETSFSENCLWFDGRLVRVGLCRFDYDWDDPLRAWRIESEDGAIALDFAPKGQHKERLRLGLVASDFKQVFGVFNGTVHDDGRTVSIRNQHGFVEDQYAKW